MSIPISSALARRIRKQASRILAGMVKGFEDQPIFPGYISFDTGERPAWWLEDLVPDNWGEVLGVHEIKRGKSVGAIVVTERGLGVFNDPLEPTWLPYEEVGGWKKLSKDPIPKTLIVRTKAGQDVELHFPQGGAFAFIQFLGYATEQLFREQSRNG